jgi:hypothetical protein
MGEKRNITMEMERIEQKVPRKVTEGLERR